MKPTSLDSNIVLRLILNDPPHQSAKAAEFVGRFPSYVTDVVVAECVFVLEKVYKLHRHLVKSLMTILLEVNTVGFNEAQIRKTLDLYISRRTLSFVDCYAVVDGELGSNRLVTFDREILKKCATIAKEPV